MNIAKNISIQIVVFFVSLLLGFFGVLAALNCFEGNSNNDSILLFAILIVFFYIVINTIIVHIKMDNTIEKLYDEMYDQHCEIHLELLKPEQSETHCKCGGQCNKDKEKNDEEDSGED